MLSDPLGAGGTDPDELERFAARLFESAGVPEAHASAVAESLVLADARGHNSHGVQNVPWYLESIAGEQDEFFAIDPAAAGHIAVDGPTHAVVDGEFGFGQVIGRKLVDAAVEKATAQGLCMIGVRDATHLGRIGEWAERVAEAGFLFAAFVNSQGGHVTAPPGSAERRFGTNPIAFGVPTFDALAFPVVLDIATTQVAAGKAVESVARGYPLDGSWTVTEDGGSITDAAAFRDGEGALLPLGGRAAGYKGFGLLVIAELFAAIAGDGLTAAQSDYVRGNAAMIVAADPALFTDRAALEERLVELREYVAETAFVPEIDAGVAAFGDEALLPGEPEHLTERDRREHGIPIPAADASALRDLAAEHDVEAAIPSTFPDPDGAA